MIFEVIFRLAISLFGALLEIALPALPAGFYTIADTVLSYISTGLNYVWLFVDQGLVTQLFYWWLSLFTILLSAELGYDVWKLIQGTAQSHKADKGN